MHDESYRGFTTRAPGRGVNEYGENAEKGLGSVLPSTQSTTSTVSTGSSVSLLHTMYTIRFFEERVKLLYQQGQITGAVHLYIGQEAVAAGVGAALRRDDFVTSTHRGHGHCLAKGGDLRLTMAELMGRATGYCHGCGGSMNLFSRDISLLGGNGIVGGGMPIALGAAYSSLYRGTDQVTVCFFSDGASNQGTFHESLNMAALWKLPLVFLCENNLYAATTPSSKTLALPDVAARAAGYGIPGAIVDGNDAEAVYEVASAARRGCQPGGGEDLSGRGALHGARLPPRPGRVGGLAGARPRRRLRGQLAAARGGEGR